MLNVNLWRQVKHEMALQVSLSHHKQIRAETIEADFNQGLLK